MRTTVRLRQDILEDVINKLRIDESRFINCCLLEVNQGIKFKEENYYPVDVNRYAELQHIESGKAIKELIELCEFHKTNSLAIPVAGNGTLHTSLIYEYLHYEEEKLLHINWNPKLIPYISGTMVAGKFLTIDTRMDGVSSSRRYSMYILLANNLWQLEKYGSFALSSLEIRTGLGLIAGEYKELNVLNSKVIKPTLKDIYSKLGINLQCAIKRGKVIFTYKEVLK